jgi:hypothetical protein
MQFTSFQRHKSTTIYHILPLINTFLYIFILKKFKLLIINNNTLFYFFLLRSKK